MDEKMKRGKAVTIALMFCGVMTGWFGTTAIYMRELQSYQDKYRSLYGEESSSRVNRVTDDSFFLQYDPMVPLCLGAALIVFGIGVAVRNRSLQNKAKRGIESAL